MLVKKFYLESRDKNITVIIGYNEGGVICFLDATGLSPGSCLKFLGYMPVKEEYLEKFKKAYPSISVTLAVDDLSFKAFYDAYNYKVGKKNIAEKRWLKLTDAEKLACYKVLPRYNKYLCETRVAKAYLETFLNNNYWENEY